MAHPRTVILLSLLLSLAGVAAAVDADALPPVDAAAAPHARSGMTAGDALAAADGFRQAQGAAEHVAVAARLAGHDVAPVTLPETRDPVELLLRVGVEARALQLEALAGMSEADWALVQEGETAARLLFEARVPQPGDDLSDPASYLRERPEHLPATVAGMRALDVDHARLWRAAHLLASGADRAQELLLAEDAALPAPGVFRTALGLVYVSTGCTNDVYTNPAFLIVDACGDDQYLAGAGGAVGTGLQPLAVTLDLEGDDRMEEGNGGGLAIVPGYAGAVLGGVAVALDVRGDDRYGLGSGGWYAGGGSTAGIGVLVEGGGSDVYYTIGYMEPAKQGGGFFAGAGVLVELGGWDQYHGDTYEQGSGWFLGLGVLFDLSGTDEYYDISTFAQGSGGVGGLGVLIDVSGNDNYASPSAYEQGAGGCGGVGVLLDVLGRDRYSSPGFGQGYASMMLLCNGEHGELPGVPAPAVGVLVDVCGDDAYTSGWVGQGHGDAGLGLLADLNGADAYAGPNPPVNDAMRASGLLGLAVDSDLLGMLGIPACGIAVPCPFPGGGQVPDCVIPWCPSPFVGVPPLCVDPTGCPPPTTGTPPRCIPPGCPPPSVGVPPFCVAATCPPPSTGNVPNCNVPFCPPPTVGVPPRCLSAHCPPPTTGTVPDCAVTPCPVPTVGVPPDCIDPRQCPPNCGTFVPCPPPSYGYEPVCALIPCPPPTSGTWPTCTLRRCPPPSMGVYPYACLAV